MKNAISILIAAVVVVLLGSSAFGQKRPPARKPAATQPPANAAAEIRSGSEKVATQIKNVTRFLYTLGGIAIRIEDLDREAKTRTLAKASLDANTANKTRILQAIANLKAGIQALEIEFRMSANLRKYAGPLEGATLLVNESEDLANAGRFSDSGRPLLDLVGKLSDTLSGLP